MKQFYRHLGGALLIGLMILPACTTPQSSAASSNGEQDTLVAMIEKQIARKKQRRQEVKLFRARYLPRNFDKKIREYYPIIRKYSKRYGLDWRLIVAQILKESYFKENARSEVGAIGLMQIMPRTAREITRELDIARISKDPRENITAGIYHLYKQLKYFPEADPVNRIKLALAAYNCGPGRIFDARDIARYKRLDPDTWSAVRQTLPLLTPDSWQLHLDVWEQGTPPHGYFYGYEQTIDYVDDIYSKYQLIKQMF